MSEQRIAGRARARAAWLAAVAGTLLAPAAHGAAVAAGDRALLAEADLGRGAPAAFRSEVRVEPLAGGEAAPFEIWREGGEALVRFEDPRQNGKAILQRADGVWLLARGARPVRLGNAGALVAGLSLQDLIAVSYARDYAVEGVERAGDGASEVVTFTLRATAPGAATPRARYVVRRATRRPLRIESLLASGRPARMVEILAWRPGSRLVPAETVVKDLLGGRPPLRVRLVALEERSAPAHLFELSPDGDAARAALVARPRGGG